MTVGLPVRDVVQVTGLIVTTAQVVVTHQPENTIAVEV